MSKKKSVKPSPKWMSRWGRAEYERRWRGFRVWRGVDITAPNEWHLAGNDLLVSPDIDMSGIRAK